jgi:hypothetical protein
MIAGAVLLGFVATAFNGKAICLRDHLAGVN